MRSRQPKPNRPRPRIRLHRPREITRKGQRHRVIVIRRSRRRLRVSPACWPPPCRLGSWRGDSSLRKTQISKQSHSSASLCAFSRRRLVFAPLFTVRRAIPAFKLPERGDRRTALDGRFVSDTLLRNDRPGAWRSDSGAGGPTRAHPARATEEEVCPRKRFATS